MDFDPITKMLTFDSDMLEVQVAINISQDALLEEREEFVVKLSVPAGERGVQLTRSVARVFIVDNNSKWFLLIVTWSSASLNTECENQDMYISLSWLDQIVSDQSHAQIATRLMVDLRGEREREACLLISAQSCVNAAQCET